MKIPIGVFIVLLLIPPSAYGADLTDIFLSTAKRELAGSRVATPPVAEGKRSPIGPQLYRRVVDSVILVVTETMIGTGVLLTPEGHVLTNAHVVGKNEVVGVVPRNPELLKGIERLRQEHVILAQVVALDVRRDLALLHMQSVPAGLRTAPLGEAGGVEVGQDVYSIGHPKGLLWSYAEGVVSQVRPDYEWVYDDGVPRRATVIQTQTPTHRGSSGGALFDGSGRIVGINYGGKDPTLSFAIAVGEVRDWIQKLAQK
jgi:putative serine protease PepD